MASLGLAEQARRWTKRMAPDGEGQVRGGWTAQDVQDGAQIMAWLLSEYEAQAKRKEEVERLVDIVFDGPPSHVAGRFVEVEDMQGHSANVGEWKERENGMWVLRLSLTAQETADE